MANKLVQDRLMSGPPHVLDLDEVRLAQASDRLLVVRDGILEVLLYKVSS